MTSPRWRRRRRAVPPDIVFVCTANQCRSPIAAALLRQRLAAADFHATVGSAGLLPPGAPIPSIGLGLMAERGIDLSSHRSIQVSDDVMHHADLVLGMATGHVREVVSAYPHAWPKAFLFKDFVRRAEATGPRDPREGFDDWLARVGEGREPEDLIGSSRRDDIRDPMGRAEQVWRSVLADIDGSVKQLAGLLSKAGIGAG